MNDPFDVNVCEVSPQISARHIIVECAINKLSDACSRKLLALLGQGSMYYEIITNV